MKSFIYDFETLDSSSDFQQGLVNFKVKIQDGNGVVGYKFGGVQYATDDNGVLFANAQFIYELSYCNGNVSAEEDVYTMGSYDINYIFNLLKGAFPLNDEVFNLNHQLIHSCLNGVRPVTYPVFE